MAFNINTFKTRGLELGGARPSLFKVIVPVWAGAESSISEKLSLVAKASSLPPSAIDSIDVGYFGRKIKIVGDRTYPNWSITVMNDEDFAVRRAFEIWHNQLNSAVGNLQTTGQRLLSSTGNYKVDIEVIQYSKTGEEPQDSNNGIRRYTLFGAFPVAIDAISLDWDATNQVEQFNVEFAYDYWIADVIDGSSAESEGISTVTSPNTPNTGNQ